MWEILAAGTLSLAGVALGGYLQRRSAQEALKATLREQRRSAVHASLAVLIDDVAAKLEESWLIIPVMAGMSQRDMEEFMNTDTGVAMREREQRIRTAMVEVGLLVGDRDLREALLGLEVALREWPEKATGLVAEAALKGGDAMSQVSPAFEHVGATRKALSAVQKRAANLLAVELNPPPPKPLRQRAASWFRS